MVMCANEFETKEKQKLTPPAPSRHPPPPEGFNGMFSILHVCMHFFIAYQARIT